MKPDIDDEEMEPLPFWKVAIWVALQPIAAAVEIARAIVETTQMVWRNRK